jgi:hypothetical protein
MRKHGKVYGQLQTILQIPELRGDIVFSIYVAVSAAFCYVKSGGESELTLPVLCQWLAWSLSALALIATYRLSPFHPLAEYPGPVLGRITKLRWAYVVFTGKRHFETAKLHDKYGVFVRTGR